MCQLLGISANHEADIRFSFREWRHRGDHNPHGYGFAYWDSGKQKIVKAASNLFKANQVLQDKIRSLQSHMFVCHVRLASVGVQDGTNTHPFQSDNFVFAHNGTVKQIKERRLQRLRPEGATDSEYAFLWMLEQLDGLSPKAFSERLQSLADTIRRLGPFNFLLSDGTTLWAYADNSLYFIERTPPYGGELVRLRDDGYKMDLAEVKQPDERAVLIATEPLSDESGWTPLRRGELLIARDGQVQQRIFGKPGNRYRPE